MTAADLLQSAIVALLVLAAAAYLGRALWRTVSSARRAKAGGDCAAGCGCSATSEQTGDAARGPARGPVKRADGRVRLGGPPHGRRR